MKTRRLTTLALTMSLMGGAAAFAQPGPADQPPPGPPGQPADTQHGQPQDDQKGGRHRGPDGQGQKPSGPPQGVQPPSGAPGQPGAPSQITPPPVLQQGGQPQGMPGGMQGGPPGGMQGVAPGAMHGGMPAGAQGGMPSGPQGPMQGAMPGGGPGGMPGVMMGQRPGAGPAAGARNALPGLPYGARWSRGDRVPQQYRQGQYAVPDWRARNLTAPPRGYQWMCYDVGSCVLVSIATGVVRETRYRDDRDDLWRRRYSRTWTYDDDIYYRECRDRPDPAGVLLGGLIGGLLGQAAGGEHRAGPTIAGVIIGSAVGAALTRDMDCEDRGYAYRSYYDALNAGRPGMPYRWTNPHSGHGGSFSVRSYYTDPNGFSCATYLNEETFANRRRTNGHACRQPDGAWVFID